MKKQKNMYGNRVNFLIVIGMSFLILQPALIFAQETVKDSDFDGISDEAEINRYKTNPDNADTDQDGIMDVREILDGTDPNDEHSNKLNDLDLEEPSLLQSTDPIAWYISRIAGISAFIMFTLVICNGLLMSSKLSLRFRNIILPANVLKAHAFNATFIAYVLLVLHFGALFFDQYFKLSLPEVFIPFIVTRNFTSNLGFDFKIPVALGVIALYLATLLVITSQFRGKIISAKLWRKVHYSSFIFYILFLVHGILSGSDSSEWWMILIYIASVIAVFGLLITRMFFRKQILKVDTVKS